MIEYGPWVVEYERINAKTGCRVLDLYPVSDPTKKSLMGVKVRAQKPGRYSLETIKYVTEDTKQEMRYIYKPSRFTFAMLHPTYNPNTLVIFFDPNHPQQKEEEDKKKEIYHAPHFDLPPPPPLSPSPPQISTAHSSPLFESSKSVRNPKDVKKWIEGMKKDAPLGACPFYWSLGKCNRFPNNCFYDNHVYKWKGLVEEQCAKLS